MASIIKLDANEHPIKSVTVFKSNKAEVVRTFRVSLEAGQSQIQIRHLPGSIDTESARVSGLGDAQLFDVVCSIGPDIEEVDSASIAEEVRRLKEKRDVLAKDRETIKDISKTMVNYAKSLSGNTVPPRQADRFFANLLSQTRDISSMRADLKEEILQLSRQIDILSSSEMKREGKTNGVAAMVIMAKKATDVELRLSYLVRDATWSAAYELHATSEAGVPVPSVSLHYRARITQSTGEDWIDVKLTLSTADMDLSNQTIPVLSSTKIGPPQSGSLIGSAQQAQSIPVPDAPLARLALAALPADEWSDIAPDEDALEERPSPALGELTAVVHESPLALTYHIEGASGVPSDNVPHQVSIAVLPFDATIQHVTVPKVRPVAYIEASVKNTSDYQLLPGTVHAFVDDSFVSKTAIVGDVAPGDVFSCTLGADPATRIRYARTSKRVDEHKGGGAFAEQWAATTYRSRTTVTNRHPFALRALVLRDGVPVSDDGKHVNVVLRHPEGLAELAQDEELKVSVKDGERESEGGSGKRTVRWSKLVDRKGGRKEGLFEWVVEIGAGEEVTIETEWDVKAPVSLKWVESA